MKVRYPKIVTKLTTLCDAWLVGSSADLECENPRDFDVFVSIDKWQAASGYIPQNAKINSFGGFKIVCEGKEVDVWTGRMEDFLANNAFSFAYHPKTGVRIMKVK